MVALIIDAAAGTDRCREGRARVPGARPGNRDPRDHRFGVGQHLLAEHPELAAWLLRLVGQLRSDDHGAEAALVDAWLGLVGRAFARDGKPFSVRRVAGLLAIRTLTAPRKASAPILAPCTLNVFMPISVPSTIEEALAAVEGGAVTGAALYEARGFVLGYEGGMLVLDNTLSSADEDALHRGWLAGRAAATPQT